MYQISLDILVKFNGVTMQSVKAHFTTRLFHYLIIVSSCLCFSSYGETWSDNLYLNGYFTLDMTVADTEFNAVSSSNEELKYEKNKISVKNSLVGGQIEYQFNDDLSVFAQGSAFYDKEGSTTTTLNWAYLSYDFGQDFKARIGSFQTPFLQGTELRSVGYSRLWARPLTPGSGASGFNKYQGIELLKHLSVGEYNWDFQLAAGQADHNLDEVDARGIELLSTRFMYQNFWIRAALLHVEYSVNTPRGQVIIDSGDVIMGSIEAEATIGQFIANVGLSTSNSDVTPDDTMYYLSLAYTFDEFTPYVFASKRNQHFVAFELPEDDNLPSRPPTGTLPMRLPPPPPDGDDNVYSLAVGSRWNFSERLALKVQFENIRIHEKSGPEDVADNGTSFSLVIEGVF